MSDTFEPFTAIEASRPDARVAVLDGPDLETLVSGLNRLGVKPDGIGFYIMAIPGSYIVGNYLTTHLSHRISERRIMRLGQILTVGGVALMLLLALMGLNTPLAFALPLVLLGIGHGLLVPPALAGTVGLLPALAGSAAAVAGLSQQLMGAVGGFAVGLFHHEGAVNLGWLMLGLALCGAAAQWRLHRGQQPPPPQRLG